MNNYEYILDFLNEVGAETGDSYEQAVINLKNYLKIKNDKKSFAVNFGEFGIASLGYNVISDKQAEEIRKYLKKIKGLKLWVRMFSTIKLAKKAYFSLAEPDMVLWEISGVDSETAENIAKDITENLGVAVKVIVK